jgi:hypothetical protein
MKAVKVFLAFLFFIILVGCAIHSNQIAPSQNEIIQGRCDSALNKLKVLAEKETDDQLLYLMEYGSALQICKNYSESNKVLIKAHQLAEENDYFSLSRGVGATLLNEQMLKYKGDKYELLMLNALTAINFLELGDRESAMVEVRRINEKTKRFAEIEKKPHELNSFAQYLAGLVYELDRKYDDACIAYQSSYRIDSGFREVVLDMLTACWRARRTDEFLRLVKTTSATDVEIEYAKRDYKKSNEKVILFLQGWGPKKATRPDDQVYPILKPVYSKTQSLFVSSQLSAQNYFKSTAPVYNIEQAAIATLEEDYKTIAIRRFGARVAKEIVADQIRQKDKAMGDIAWLIMVASERADLRNWTLLPQTIQVLRVDANQVSAVQLSGRGAAGAEYENFGIIDFSVDKSKKVYTVRSLK